ncbi:MAG: 50S ribosomal protein L25 [Actinomycetes bacterium]
MALTTNVRTDFGKGAARRLRREGQTPAVIYGHGQAPVHVSLDSHELILTLRKRASSIEILVDGKTQIVTPRDIQIEPVRRYVEHVDLVVVTAAEAATIEREATAASAAAEASASAAAESAAAKAATRAARQEEAGTTGEDNSAATEGANESAQ